MITITVNGDEKRISEGQTIADYIIGLGFDPTKVAVERNREIAPKSTFNTQVLSAGDTLEIVHFIGGGNNA
ncbi:thiamine biosynthesis protein ThiS [Kordiimonas sediminis]|uniref:Thiamine biosynthesis protein ThiS n=1 Tax=Kordiimonas sediminis TaxID=1735581 RepID=A0A919AVC7_9PROT|nr:sulfur carrier protein ThiS [Kordiimonas sediminis]GHF27404.1 thiamine biosynthesis protein ThiS [Kordiimonas sediminis]